MPIEIIPKEAAKLPLWQNILFYLSIALLLACVSGYFVLTHFTKKAELTLKIRETTLEEGKTSQMISLEKEISDYKKKIEDFSSLIAVHQMGSKFFGILEKNTHPKVFFTELNLNIKNNKVILSGQTEDFKTLGQQILIFQKEEMINSIKLSSVKISKEGKIEFSLEIIFKPELFTQW